jgi:transglutaminase-like putative cysteine protease
MEITKDEAIEISMFNTALTTTDPRQIKAILNSEIFNTNISEISKYSILIAISENPVTPEDIREKCEREIFSIQMKRRESAFLRLERKEPNTVKPKPLDILPSRSSNGYTIIIPEFFDKELEFFVLKNEADRFAGDTKGLVRAYKLSEFVYKNIEYDENWNKKSIVTLNEAIEKGKGVCKEKALILYMLLASNDFDASYVKGYLISDNNERYGHAWVKLRIYNMNYLIDPTNNVFVPYDLDFVSKHYEEVDASVLRVE